MMPMHALVWFLNSETVHRNALCHASEAAELSSAEMEPCSRFELESLFSFSYPQAIQLFDGSFPDSVGCLPIASTVEASYSCRIGLASNLAVTIATG
jgi:hypothetical protein